MKLKPLPLTGAYEIERAPHIDARGIFCRLYDYEILRGAGVEKPIAQINHSVTNGRGIVRGMHFQHPPAAETKIVSCLEGRVLDVIVDIRRGSATFLKWCAVELNAARHNTVIVPEGFAHGFQTLEDRATLVYATTAPYSKEHESGLRCTDPRLAISWPMPPAGLSERDQTFRPLDDAFSGVAP